MDQKKENTTMFGRVLSNKSSIAIFLLMLNFFGFGLFHLTKFETVDEHFWKYERIGKYWQGIKQGIGEGNWKKTYINDKPGVTVALISGTGLIFEPHPELHRNRDPLVTDDNNYTVYNQDQTEKINFAFRFPILLLNVLLLPILYWLITKIANRRIAMLTTIFIATSPILIGMSQVINPDALLWSFASLAIFSFLALLKKGQRKYLIISSVFTGLSLLSKYTANILFLFYIVAIFLNAYYAKKYSKNDFYSYLKKQLYNFLIIFISSGLIYTILLPAVFIKSKYLYEGTIGSPAFENILLPFLIFIVLWAFDLLVWQAKISFSIIVFVRKTKNAFLLTLMALFTLLMLLILFNPHLPNSPLPLDDVKEESSYEGELLFPQIQSYQPIFRGLAMLAIEMQPFIFSLGPIVILGIFLLFVWGFLRKIDPKYNVYIISLLVFILAYFLGNLISGVFTNPRYCIMLYPLIYFLAALGIYSVLNCYKKSKSYYHIFFLVIFIFGFVSLYLIKPFYLNYENILLPKEYVLTDAWGYGQYEAAQFLNSQDNPKDVVIWSDVSGVYQFIKGKGIREYRIDLEKTIPQYFVFSRRGSIRHRFKWAKPELAPRDNLYYYNDNIEDIVWQLEIGGRNKNYVRIVKVDY